MDQNSDSTNPVVPTPAVPVSDTPAPDTTSGSSVDSAENTPEPVVTPDPVVDPTVIPDSVATGTNATVADTETPAEVAKKISESQNVLIALSSDPSVDEMAAAIGLSIYLDRLGKRATAIYSGATPNALEFLNPEENFEPSVDTLQDFVIALDKEKADHLRYKLDGDYVKIFITPYKTRISDDDLDFSYGDFNVDLVIALNVINGIDLDDALREHGRIMHDAVIVNVTTGNPGKFGEIEWSNKSASSVSEMIAKLLYDNAGKVKIEKEEATAFLTGIVAATERFSNAKTSSETMEISSKLMESGANQQLVSKNITPDMENNFQSALIGEKSKQNDDPTKLDIEHGEEENSDTEKTDGEKTVDTPITEQDSELMDDLKTAAADLSQAGDKTVPDDSNKPVNMGESANVPSIDDLKNDLLAASQDIEAAETNTNTVSETAPVVPSVMSTPVETPTSDFTVPEPAVSIQPPMNAAPTVGLEPAPTNQAQEGIEKSEKVLQPSGDLSVDSLGESTEKYGKMLEDALSSIGSEATTSEPATIIGASMNPASEMAPTVPTTPEINGVPEINYMPMPGEEVLPPPPTPPIDMNIPVEETYTAPAVEPVQPAVQPVTPPVEPVAPTIVPETPASLGAQPAAQDQVYSPQATDPSAFKIPDM